MIELPEDTRVHKRIPKETFYKHLQLNRSLKEKFFSDIENVFVEWTLTTKNLHLSKTQKQDEIILLLIQLKKKDFDSKILEVIAKQNPHKLVFILTYAEEMQLAIYHSKLYLSPWMSKSTVKLVAKGLTVVEIMDSFIEQIALDGDTQGIEQLSIDDRLTRREQIEKIQRQIEKTEAAAWKESQPKKRFELYGRVQKYKKMLEEIKNG